MLGYFNGILSQKKSSRKLLFGSSWYNEQYIDYIGKKPIYAFLLENLLYRKWFLIYDYELRDIARKNNDVFQSTSLFSFYGKVYTITRFLTKNWYLVEHNSALAQNIISFLMNMFGYIGHTKYYIISILKRYLENKPSGVSYEVLDISDVFIGNQNFEHLNAVVSNVFTRYLILCDNPTLGHRRSPFNFLTMQYKTFFKNSLYILFPIQAKRRENAVHVTKVYGEGIFKEFSLHDEGIYTLSIKKVVKNLYEKKLHRLLLERLEANSEYTYGVTSVVRVADMTFVQIDMSLDIVLKGKSISDIVEDVKEIIRKATGIDEKSYRIVQYFTVSPDRVESVQVIFSFIISAQQS